MPQRLRRQGRHRRGDARRGLRAVSPPAARDTDAAFEPGVLADDLQYRHGRVGPGRTDLLRAVNGALRQERPDIDRILANYHVLLAAK